MMPMEGRETFRAQAVQGADAFASPGAEVD
jgi:hypothetical protein